MAAGTELPTLEYVRCTLVDLTVRRESREKALLTYRHLVSSTPVILAGASIEQDRTGHSGRGSGHRDRPAPCGERRLAV